MFLIILKKYEVVLKNINLSVVKDIMKDHCMNLTNEQFNFLKKDKLYISYTKNGVQKIRCKFKNRQQLLDSILKKVYIYLI